MKNIIIIFIFSTSLFSQSINRSTLNSGGVKSSNSSYILNGSVSQQFVGESSSAGYVLGSGFWYGIEHTIVQEETPNPDDTDADGILNAIEDAAPNNGDGNNDGIQDSEQVNITSIESVNVGSYITVELTSCDSLLNVENYIRTESGKYEFPFGVISFSAPCSEAIVKVFYHNVDDLSIYTYRKELADGRWIDYEESEFSIETIDGQQVAVATLTLTDGGIGDSDGIVNGTIVDPGGPAIPITANIPIWDWWWVLVIIPVIIYSYKRIK